jgi:hypothetical protein
MDWTGRLFLIGWVALVAGAVAVLVMPPAPVLQYSYSEQLTRTEQIPVDPEALYGLLDPYVTQRVHEVVGAELEAGGTIAGAVAASVSAASAQAKASIDVRVTAIDQRAAALETTVQHVEERTTAIATITRDLVEDVAPMWPASTVVWRTVGIVFGGLAAMALGWLGIRAWRRRRARHA